MKPTIYETRIMGARIFLCARCVLPGDERLGVATGHSGLLPRDCARCKAPLREAIVVQSEPAPARRKGRPLTSS